MCFSKHGKESSETFFTTGHFLVQVAEYPYIGLNICNTDYFKAASKALIVKASNALYKWKQLLTCTVI